MCAIKATADHRQAAQDVVQHQTQELRAKLGAYFDVQSMLFEEHIAQSLQLGLY